MQKKKEKSGNSPAVKKFIRENAVLFWYIRDDAKENISEELLVETILNFGNIKSVGKLFRLLGIEKVSNIFYSKINNKRHNYLKLTEHFFKLYFNKNVRETSQ